MQCKSCGFKSGPAGMGKHYKEEPNHSPKYRGGGKSSRRGGASASAFDRLIALRDEFVVEISAASSTISDLKDKLKDAQAELYRLQDAVRMLDTVVNVNQPPTQKAVEVVE